MKIKGLFLLITLMLFNTGYSVIQKVVEPSQEYLKLLEKIHVSIFSGKHFIFPNFETIIKQDKRLIALVQYKVGDNVYFYLENRDDINNLLSVISKTRNVLFVTWNYDLMHEADYEVVDLQEEEALAAEPSSEQKKEEASSCAIL